MVLNMLSQNELHCCSIQNKHLENPLHEIVTTVLKCQNDF